MKSVGSYEAKTHLPRLLSQVEKGETITITKRGKPVAKLVPAPDPADDVFGYMAGKVKIIGDIVGPVTPLKDWESF